MKPVLDAAGRLNRLDRWRTSPGDWLARTTVGYDPVSRVSSLATDVTGTNYDLTLGLTYNPASQIATVSRDKDVYAFEGQVNSELAYTADGLNRYTGASFTYDANGNLTSDSSNSFAYDVENRLVTRSGALSATAHYDPLGRLYQVVSGSTTRRFLYDGSDRVAEYNAAGTMQRRYVHGLGAGDDPIVSFTGSTVADSARRYLYADERGSIIVLTDSAGTATSRNQYDEYGIRGSSPSGDFQYTGQVWVGELGMYYYKARMYSPVLGRFMQTDPIGYGDGMNMYAYVGNDSINRVDPTGLLAKWQWSCYGNCAGGGYWNTGIGSMNPSATSSSFEISGRGGADGWRPATNGEVQDYITKYGGWFEGPRGDGLHWVWTSVGLFNSTSARMPPMLQEEPQEEQTFETCMKDRMGALGWAIDGAANVVPGVNEGIGAQEFMSDADGVAWLGIGAAAVADIGMTPGTDGISAAERAGGRAARAARIMTGGSNYRQMRSAVRAGRSFGRSVPTAALGTLVFMAFYSGTSAGICSFD